MRIRQLEAFRAVMLCQTVTRAAEMLHISQPAATRLIADLEASVGFALFERVRGRLIPTPEAQTLFEEVQQSLLGVDRIARTAEEIRHQERGVLQVAAAPALSISFLPKATARFLAERPQTPITLLSHSSRTVVDMVVGQRCDIGFAILAMNTPSTHGEPLLATRMVCAVPAGHRLASYSVVTPTDLKGEHFASFPRLLDTRLHIDALFAAHGVERILRFETQISQGLCGFVESGLAVALVDAVTAMEYPGHAIRFIPFEPSVRMDFTVLVPAQRRPAMLVQTYVQYVREEALARLDPRHVITP
jgi:DNA-binding transcriptional LysR family regulator